MGNNQSTGAPEYGIRDVLKAAEEGNLALLSMIMVKDIATVRTRSACGGNSAWHKAAKGGQLEVIKGMADFIYTNFDSFSKGVGQEVFQLQRMGSTADGVIKYLLNVPNFKGITPLMLAAAKPNVELVTWMLARGADVTLRDRVRCQTALHYAVESGDAECVRIILNTAEEVMVDGVSLVEAGNHAGLTAMHYATFLDKQEVMKVLLSFRANVSAQAEYFDLDWPSVNAGDTPMHVAASKGNVEAIRILLRGYNELSGNMVPEQGLPARVRDPRAIRNDYGRLAYHVAVRKGHSWLCEMLDPAVPVRYLMSGEDLDVSRMYGPPRLANIAASVLHQSLVSDLVAIQGLVAQEAEAAAAISPRRAAQLAALAAAREKSAAEAAAGAADTAAANVAAAAAAARSSGRRWSFGGLRRQLTGSEPGAGGRRGAAPGAGGGREEGEVTPTTADGVVGDAAAAGIRSPRASLRSPRVSATAALGVSSEAPAGAEGGEAAAGSPCILANQGFGTVSVQLLSRAGTGGGAAGAGAAAAVVACCGPEADGCCAVDEVAGAAGTGCCADGKVSPLPEGDLTGHAGGQLLEGLMKTFRWGPKVTPVMSRTTSCAAHDDALTCGVCLDATPTARIVPCQHQLCAECALDIVKRYSLSTAVCPFCRALVRGFAPSNVDLDCVGRYLAMKQKQQRSQQQA